MEKLKNKWKNLPLRRFFILTVLLSVSIVAFLSVLIIGGCMAFRYWLLPDSQAVYLTIEETLADGTVQTDTYLMDFDEDLSALPFLRKKDDTTEDTENVQQTRYAIQKMEPSIHSLTPKRKFAYQACGVIMFVAPIVMAFVAILICGMYFYKRKLRQPLEVLESAVKQMAEQNLDFKIEYECSDEMGKLCHSFENMREELYKNNKDMWNMLEERQLMQASIAHDLRNPIAILEGYTEYLEKGLKGGEINREKMLHIIQNMGVTAKRLEQYTESVRLLNQSEETQLQQKIVTTLELIEELTEDLSLLTEKKGITLQVSNHLPEKEIRIDCALLYRILENVIGNAIRYAKQEIQLDFSLQDTMLFVTVTDDGDGFSSEILNKKEKKLLMTGENGHMGIGLSVSRLLCQKHGGKLELFNTSSGACVKISLSV